METRNLLARRLIIAALIVIACVWRVVNAQFQLAPNLEFLTAVSFGAATLGLTSLSTAAPAVISITTSLLVYGPSTIDLFTMSAWLVIGLGTGATTSRLRERPIPWSALPAAAASTFFFLWTNFGVWLTSSMYSHTARGLLECYVAGLPFYRTMLLGNLVIVPLVVAVARPLTVVGSGINPVHRRRPALRVSTPLTKWSQSA